MRAPRRAPLTRVLSLLRVLEGGGRHQLQTLAAEFGVCKRTVMRDLDALEESGFPLTREVDWETDGRTYVWLLNPPCRRARMPLAAPVHTEPYQ